jgi:ferric iron reductase protein FhuF
MKGPVNRQKCALAELPAVAPELKMKCITVMVFEEAGKTILQPLVNEQAPQNIHELFQNRTLEVWLPNGQPTPAQFDIAILKYKQLMQPSKMCSKNTVRICLKNQFDTIVSCDQCPLGDDGAKE